jgi:hypothetical protein
MPITVSTILNGPGLVTLGGGYFYGEGLINLKLIEEKFEPRVDFIPGIGKRPKDRRYELTFTPCGEWEHLSVLFPHGNTAIGAQLFSGAECVIWALDGTKHTLHNAAITKMPGITAGIGSTLLGDLQITGLLKEGKDPHESGAYLTTASDSYPGNSNFSISAIKTPVWTRSWGASPWDSIHVADGGVKFDFPLQLRPLVVDGLGTVGMVVTGRSASAKFTPVGKTVAEVLTAVGSGAAMGSTPTVNDFICSGTGVYIALYDAQMEDPGFNWHSQANRLGEVTLTATQTMDAGATNPLFLVGTAAP